MPAIRLPSKSTDAQARIKLRCVSGPAKFIGDVYLSIGFTRSFPFYYQNRKWCMVRKKIQGDSYSNEVEVIPQYD